MIKTNKNNTLIGKTIFRTYAGCFFITLFLNINLLINVLLAAFLVAPNSNNAIGSNLLGYNAIGAIAVTTPILAIAAATLLTVVQGNSKRLSASLGRGDKEETNKIFSQGFWAIVLVGGFLSVLNFFTADFIVPFFGAGTSELVYYSSTLLKVSGFSYIFTGLGAYYMSVMRLHGQNKETFIGSFLLTLCNVIFSIIFFSILKNTGASFLYLYGTNYSRIFDIGCLGLGSLVGSIIVFIYLVVAKKVHKIDVSLVKFSPSFKHLGSMFKQGIGETANLIIDAILSGTTTTIIVYASCWSNDFNSINGSKAVAAFAIVMAFWQLAKSSSEAIGISANPMISFFYQAKDVAGAQKVCKGGTLGGLLFSGIWIVILLAFSPLLVLAFTNDSKQIGEMALYGILTLLPFGLVYTLIFMLSTFYQSIGKKFMANLVTLIPYSVIFVGLIAILLNTVKLGNNSGFIIWLSLGGSAIIFILGYWIFLMIKYKRTALKLENVLNMNINDMSQLDVSIHNSIEEISELTEKVHNFLKEEQVSERTSYITALCIDELANDIVSKGIELGKNNEQDSYMDIKMISYSDKLKVIISNASKPYNPLDYDKLNPDFSKIGVRLAQKAADFIEYARIYKMNIITIEIAR